MNRIYNCFLVLFLITFFSACTNDYVYEDILEDNNQIVESRIDAAGGKDEKACMIDGKPGILCEVSVGNTCKKLHGCEPLTSAEINASHFFTASELNNWMNTDYRNNRPFMIHMWEIGYFVHPDSLR